MPIAMNTVATISAVPMPSCIARRESLVTTPVPIQPPATHTAMSAVSCSGSTSTTPMNSAACVMTASESPTMMVPGISSSGTRRKRRKTAVVVASEPMPSVSKKLVTSPMTRWSGVGLASAPPAFRRDAPRFADPAEKKERAARDERADQGPDERHAVMRWDRSRRHSFGSAAIVLPARTAMDDRDDTFELYDLRVEVVATDRPMVCGHHAGDWFEVHGENLRFRPARRSRCMRWRRCCRCCRRSSGSRIRNDWMTTDAEIACPDPNCGARFRITRIGTRHVPPSAT